MKIIVEDIYLRSQFDAACAINCLHCKNNIPHKAIIERCMDIVTCGQDPFIKARWATKLLVKNKDEKEIVTWRDPDVYMEKEVGNLVLVNTGKDVALVRNAVPLSPVPMKNQINNKTLTKENNECRTSFQLVNINKLEACPTFNRHKCR